MTTRIVITNLGPKEIELRRSADQTQPPTVIPPLGARDLHVWSDGGPIIVSEAKPASSEPKE